MGPYVSEFERSRDRLQLERDREIAGDNDHPKSRGFWRIYVQGVEVKANGD
jgi:hypothetical protein